MYELKKKIGKVFTSKFVVSGSSSYKKKKEFTGRGLTKVEKHWARRLRLPEFLYSRQMTVSRLSDPQIGRLKPPKPMLLVLISFKS